MKNICLSRQRSDKKHRHTGSPDQFKDGDHVYIKNHATSTWEPNWERSFCLNKFLTPCSAILESTLNGKTRILNIGDMLLADPTKVIETEDTPNRWGRKAKLLFNDVPDAA